jgi:hypothetical protein
MKIYEITRPIDMRDATAILRRHGYEQLGYGVYAKVFARQDEPFVLKIFNGLDMAYISYLKLITRVRNPHFPVVKGKPVKVNDEYWAVRLERLEPIEGMNNDLHMYVKEYVINYQKLASLEDEYYTKTTADQRARNGITDDDRRILDQLGEIPDDWRSYKGRVNPNDKFLSPMIAGLRERVVTFEKHFPDLAEALRLIEKYVLQGMPPDLHSENVMQRGSVFVITDPSSSGVEGTSVPMASPRQPELFSNPAKTWDQRQQQFDYKSLSNRLPLELKGQNRDHRQYGMSTE